MGLLRYTASEGTMITLQAIAKWASLFLTAPGDGQQRRKEAALRHLDAEGINLADLAEEAYYFGRGLSSVVLRAEHRLRRLTQNVQGGELSADIRPFVRDAQRVTSRLKQQLLELQQACTDLSSPEFLQARELLAEKLFVPEFGRELLGRENGRWTRPPEAWEPILDVLLRRAEYRVEYAAMEEVLAKRERGQESAH